ncbi:DUF4836 family protein [Niastella caeni]|uniref:DUF4836 family protein n=1 Tax=Niastella caeni TaxID=2569763 RepID=A0A4S8I472_9BACT|nr:DUF4836 family protein [Niastella caeni]THU41262.1 DUF4836 family protein [Niastella caeni]
MQRNLLSLVLLSIVISGLVSCSRTKPGIAVPKDASLAVHININSLTSKVSWQEIQQNDWFKELYADETDSLSKKILDNPANSGIDIKADLAFFVKKEGQGGYMAFEGGVKDASAFEAFATKANKGGKVVKEGDVNVLATSLKSLVAWTDSRFIYIADASMPSVSGRLNSSSFDSREPFSFRTDSLQKFAMQLFDLPGKNNLMSDDRFASLLKDPGDIHYWVNAEQYYNSLGGFLSLLKLNVLFEGNAYGATLNFENGKIAFKSRAYYNKELNDLMKKYAGSKVDAATINRIPSKNVVAVFALKYPPQGLKDLIKLIGVDGFVNSFFSGVGYSTDEFVKANKGDLLLSVTDVEMKTHSITAEGPDGAPYPQMEIPDPGAKVLFATSVNDKPSFDKLFGILQTKAQEFVPDFYSKIHFQLNNDWFAASNSPEQVNAFLSGGNNQFPFANRISGKAFGGYINVQQLLRSVSPAFATDSSAKLAMDASINMWQDIVITGGDREGDAFIAEAEVNLVDKSTNSLKQLNKYLDTISKLKHPRHRRYDVQVNYSDPAALSLAALKPVLHP